MTAAMEQPRPIPGDNDIELIITSLKKGAHILKYGQRGKPRFCPFRLSNDESTLVWFSGKEEKHLKLSHVSRIIPGQRTAVFQRHPSREKECQSFSLIYDDKSLDLICKDKEEAEVWLTGLKALIAGDRGRKGRGEPVSGHSSEATSPKAQTGTSSPIRFPLNGGSSHKDGLDVTCFNTPRESPPKIGFEKALSEVIYSAMPPKGYFPSDLACGSIHSMSSGGSDGITGCIRGMNADAFRVSLSSAFSSSSQGSGHDDGDPLGDIYFWGEGTGDGVLGGGMQKVGSRHGDKLDSLLPKALESAFTLDVQNVACGGQHAALVTKQGDVFSWGKELGGRLGHCVDSDVPHPKLIESLRNINVEHVACGEYHSCAVTLSGDMYIWGGSAHNPGNIRHRNEGIRWIPKKLGGPLDGIHVSSVSCGPWHTAVVTSAGQLFTFGDGTFGVLGHGDCQSVSVPREVESLKGLRTVQASCGVWHTAAIVEVIVGTSSSSNCSSGKLFTWGDGDKGRLGHGDKLARLVPTYVATLVEPNFCQVTCGYSLTVALTTTGQVYTMGSPLCGQLGSPGVSGELPTRIEGNLLNSFVQEIACGAYHVAVLTSKSEVYTWGKGANGQLGHGDTDDRNSPSLVEALKDKRVKSIACGSSFTAAICLHKWVSGVDQSMCSGCRLPFNFKRKRHNCYNCGLAFCHSCSSKKSLKASMAPVSNKPFRVCDHCYEKLRKTSEANSSSHTWVSRRGAISRGLNVVESYENVDSKIQVQLCGGSSIGLSKERESRSTRRKKLSFISRASSPPGGTSKYNGITKSSHPAFGSSKKFFSVSLPGSRMVSRASSPTSRRSSPPHPKTPTTALSSLVSSDVVVCNNTTKNDSINDEVAKLKAQIEGLTRKTQLQGFELESTTKQLKEAVAVAGEQASKCEAAKEVIKSLTAQLKEMAERFPTGATRDTTFSPNEDPAHQDAPSAATDQLSSPNSCHEFISNSRSNGMPKPINADTFSHLSSNNNEIGHSEPTAKGRNRARVEPNYGDEWVEQNEPGVYITLVALPGGVRDLKRVRFSRKRFTEKQAEQWWANNRTRLYQQYNVPIVEKLGLGTLKEELAR